MIAPLLLCPTGQVLIVGRADKFVRSVNESDEIKGGQRTRQKPMSSKEAARTDEVELRALSNENHCGRCQQ